MSIAQYIHKLLPPSSEITFLYQEDFDGDNQDEIILGLTNCETSPPNFSVFFISYNGQDLTHQCILTNTCNPESLYDESSGIEGIIDNAFVADTNGDGKSELIITLITGNGHFLTPYLFNWVNKVPTLVWTVNKTFYHGSLDVMDVDLDGIFEVVIEESIWYGKDILSLAESSPHMRLSNLYKWDGKTYKQKPFQPQDTDRIGHNISLYFLLSIAKAKYNRAYELIQLPYFLGLNGVDDNSFDSFLRYLNKNILPILNKNLEKGLLIPADLGYFKGEDNDFIFRWSKDKGLIKIHSITINPKNPS
ncbi:MAG: hypothetical protein CVU87_03430 [Firmicutes bacterium HGW-Firmicutes-12]|jgi:hypothetical protein|nr:MAG: hypothetical protein CVU87_03430 [Firmicutes bacterium HGW-Firmicutes-12]